MFSRSLLPSALGLLASAALFQYVGAQTSTSCQPLNTTNCPADPAFGSDHTWYFNSTPSSDIWEVTAGSVSYDTTNGAAFTINKQGDSPTIRTKFYYFFGRTEVWMKTSPGTGIISSVMMLSDDLDEIDWEFLGGNGTHAETNYFGKGRQDYHNAIYYPVSGGTEAGFHNYTTVWTKTSLEYWIDDQLVRTLLPADANSTNNYPQTPMRLSLGIWAGGDPTLPEGTRQWAGGDTDYTKGPFNFYVKSVRVTDYSTNSSEYTYGDQSGTASSIKITSGNSTAVKALSGSSTSSSETISQKWNDLSPVARTAVYACAAGVAVVALAWGILYFIRQRKRGAREAALAEARANEERMELARFKLAGVDPDGLVAQSEYDAREMQLEGITQNNSYSIPNSSEGMSPSREKWETAAAMGVGAGTGAAVAAGANGMRSPMPLLQTGAQSPRMVSPAPSPYSDHPMNNSVSPVHSMHSTAQSNPIDHLAHSPAQISPITSPNLGMQPQVVSPVQRFGTPDANRAFSSPNANMRVGSPGPQYAAMQRMGSPVSLHSPQPQRSFSTGPFGGPQQQQPGSPYSEHSPSHGNQGGGAFWNGNANGNAYGH